MGFRIEVCANLDSTLTEVGEVLDRNSGAPRNVCFRTCGYHGCPVNVIGRKDVLVGNERVSRQVEIDGIRNCKSGVNTMVGDGQVNTVVIES